MLVEKVVSSEQVWAKDDVRRRKNSSMLSPTPVSFSGMSSPAGGLSL